MERAHDAAIVNRKGRRQGVEDRFGSAIEPGIFYLMAMHGGAKQTDDVLALAPRAEVRRLHKRVHRDLFNHLVQKDADVASAGKIPFVGRHFEVGLELLGRNVPALGLIAAAQRGIRTHRQRSMVSSELAELDLRRDARLIIKQGRRRRPRRKPPGQIGSIRILAEVLRDRLNGKQACVGAILPVRSNFKQPPIERRVIPVKRPFCRPRWQHRQVHPRLRPRQRHIQQPAVLTFFFGIQVFLDRALGDLADREPAFIVFVIDI